MVSIKKKKKKNARIKFIGFFFFLYYRSDLSRVIRTLDA